MNEELKNAIVSTASKRGWDPLDLATVMSYETAGTFDPWKAGPTTQHGTHHGLIQWGEPQAKEYGVSQDTTIADQVEAAGRYLEDRGVKYGDGILPIYAAINAGHASKINASDSNNGGAPGTVLDKVRDQMDGHRRNAVALIGGSFKPTTVSPDLSSASIETPAAPDKQVQLPDPEQASLWQLTKDAAATQQTAPWLYQKLTATTPEADPNWLLTTDRIKADFEARGLPVDETHMDMVDGSVSEAHYTEKLSAAQVNVERLNRLSAAGMTGTTLQIANQILDPVALAADIAASSVAPQLVLANRGRRIHRVLAGALAGGAGALASEGLSEAVNPNHQTSDLFYGTVIGMGVGSVVGSLMKGHATLNEATMLQSAARREVETYEDGISALVPNAGSVGAAKVGKSDLFLKDDGFEFLDIAEMNQSAFGAARYSLSAYLNSSSNVVTRGLAGLVQDGVGKKGGAINHIAASEDKDRLVTEFGTRLGRVSHPQLKAFIKEKNIPFAQRGRAEYDFGVEVNKFMFDRRKDRADYYPKSVVATGQKLKELYHEAMGLQKNPFTREQLQGRPVNGALDVVDDGDWSGPRYWDEQRVVLAHADYQKGELNRLFEGAIRSAQKDIDEDLLKRIAQGFVTAITKRAHGLEAMARGNVGIEDMEELVQTLMNHGGLARADADALLKSFKAPGSDAGRDASLKRRMLLDESFRLEGPDGPRRASTGTVDEKGVGIMDLISQDAIGNFNRYIRPTMGRVALARYRFKDPVTGDVLINGITSDGEFRKLLDKVVQKNGDLINEGKVTRKEADAEVKRLEFAYASIMGRPLNDLENTSFGWWSRIIRKYNFARLMNQVGFAQVSEVGMPIAHLGVKASFSQMPALRRVMSQDGETILKSGLADDMEVWVGLGGDRMVASAEYRFDDLTGIHDAPSGTWRDKAEYALNVGGRLTSEASGLTQANVMLNRWTAASIVQRFADMAHGSKGLTKARLADLGLDEDMTKRVLASFKEPGNFEYSKGWLTNKKVTRAHFDKWADKEAAEAFRQATYRLASTIIQKNDIGNLMVWMSHPAAKMLMQFRTFMVGAYEKQTLKSLHMRDGTAYRALAATAGFAGLSYVIQTKIAAMGRSDQDEFLEKRLSWGSIGTAAFARAGASSIIPMLVDTGRYMAGANPVFSHTRSTGQVSNMMFGNPAMGGLDDLAEAFRGISRGVTEGDYSQEEARAFARILPFGNAVPASMGLNALISDLPEFAPRSYYNP